MNRVISYTSKLFLYSCSVWSVPLAGGNRTVHDVGTYYNKGDVHGIAILHGGHHCKATGIRHSHNIVICMPSGYKYANAWQCFMFVLF